MISELSYIILSIMLGCGVFNIFELLCCDSSFLAFCYIFTWFDRFKRILGTGYCSGCLHNQWSLQTHLCDFILDEFPNFLVVCAYAGG